MTPLRKVVFFITCCFLVMGRPISHVDAGGLLQLYHDPRNPHFDWNWNKVIANLPKIKASGYTAILISPHQKACGGQWSVGYDPYDFREFNSSHGSHNDLKTLVEKTHQQGLQIYADMVMNHMCINNFQYPRFSKDDFHHDGGISNWNDPAQLENGSVFGLEDLRQESPYVRGELWNYLVKTNDMGFDGYRWDAAKHVPKWFWNNHIVPNVNAWGKYNFGEVYDSNIALLQTYVDTGMAVTDYNLYFAMKDAFRFGGNLAVLDGAGFAAVNGSKALTFVQNHDVGPPDDRLLAYAFIASYPGYPLFFDVSLNDPTMNNLVWIQNNLAKGRYVSRYNDQHTLIYERDHHLLVGINQNGQWANRWVQTSWKNTALHDYTGHVQDVFVNNDGYVEIRLPPFSYVMLAP